MQFDSTGDKMFRVNEKGRPRPSFCLTYPSRARNYRIYSE